MAVKKVRHGWVAPFDASLSVEIEEGRPTGVFVHDQKSFGVMLNYTGINSAAEFILPRDKKALRAIARAIQKFAEDTDHVKE